VIVRGQSTLLDLLPLLNFLFLLSSSSTGPVTYRFIGVARAVGDILHPVVTPTIVTTVDAAAHLVATTPSCTRQIPTETAQVRNRSLRPAAHRRFPFTQADSIKSLRSATPDLRVHHHTRHRARPLPLATGSASATTYPRVLELRPPARQPPAHSPNPIYPSQLAQPSPLRTPHSVAKAAIPSSPRHLALAAVAPAATAPSTTAATTRVLRSHPVAPQSTVPPAHRAVASVALPRRPAVPTLLRPSAPPATARARPSRARSDSARPLRPPLTASSIATFRISVNPFPVAGGTRPTSLRPISSSSRSSRRRRIG